VGVLEIFMQALAEAPGIAFHSTEQLLQVMVAEPVRLVLPANAHRGPKRQTDCYYDK
jgi:hypothetical protein